MGGGYAFSFLRFWRMGGHEQNCEVRPHFDKTGDSKGVPFGTQPLEQRCSVLYLLARLAGKMRVSHDGHTRFIRQESGQVLRIGMSKKPVRFWKWQQVYEASAHTFKLLQFQVVYFRHQQKISYFCKKLFCNLLIMHHFFNGTLPDYQDANTTGEQIRFYCFISCNIRIKLFLPETYIAFRSICIFAICMSMPITAMYKNGYTLF